MPLKKTVPLFYCSHSKTVNYNTSLRLPQGTSCHDNDLRKPDFGTYPWTLFVKEGVTYNVVVDLNCHP